MKAIIMAGGGGTRLFPLSRKCMPKQFLGIDRESSLLEETIRRCRSFANEGDILIVTNELYREHVEKELAASADVTITDFSSIMFEPAFLYKPVFLYAPDKDEYQNVHPLLLSYDKLPFPVCNNNDELARAIVEYDESEYRCRLNKLFDKYDVHEDEYASERAAMYILGLLDAKR